jgi:hypothetical protein
MNREPELIDIYAAFAMLALMQKPITKGKSKIDLAYEAFGQAEAMLEVREDFIDKSRDSHE